MQSPGRCVVPFSENEPDGAGIEYIFGGHDSGKCQIEGENIADGEVRGFFENELSEFGAIDVDCFGAEIGGSGGVAEDEFAGIATDSELRTGICLVIDWVKPDEFEFGYDSGCRGIACDDDFMAFVEQCFDGFDGVGFRGVVFAERLKIHGGMGVFGNPHEHWRLKGGVISGD